MPDIDNVIVGLEINIVWIANNDAHQFPGWLNVVQSMGDAIEVLKVFKELQERRVRDGATD